MKKNHVLKSSHFKKFTFYLQYPHFFHIRISQITFMIITVDTKHQLLINNHFHILNAAAR